MLPLEACKRATKEDSPRATQPLPWHLVAPGVLPCSLYSQRCSSSRQALQNLARIGLQTDKVLASECGWVRAALGLTDLHLDRMAGTATEVSSFIFSCSQVRVDTASHPAACPSPGDWQSASSVSAGRCSSPACSTKLWMAVPLAKVATHQADGSPQEPKACFCPTWPA